MLALASPELELEPVVGSVADADWWLKWRNFRLEGRAGQQKAGGQGEGRWVFPPLDHA